MKLLQITVLILLSVCSVMVSSSPAAESARDIMAKVDTVFRNFYTTQVVRMELSTCKYTVRQENMHCSEKPRIVVFENVTKRVRIDNKDTRAVAIIVEPISDKGISMLTYEYDERGKDNDNWLYLPAFGKVKRIVSGSEDNDESGSFFGSEFTVTNAESIEYRKIDDYTYRILEETTYENHPVWIIETTPTPERAKKTTYGKFVTWIDKERYILLKEDLYDRNGKHRKQRIEKNHEKLENAWLAKKVTMNNLLTSRVSLMEMISVAIDMEVPDEFLTQRTLTDFAFRERNLVKLRSYLK